MFRSCDRILCFVQIRQDLYMIRKVANVTTMHVFCSHVTRHTLTTAQIDVKSKSSTHSLSIILNRVYAHWEQREVTLHYLLP